MLVMTHGKHLQIKEKNNNNETLYHIYFIPIAYK